jgi:hypothetical protein
MPRITLAVNGHAAQTGTDNDAMRVALPRGFGTPGRFTAAAGGGA